MMIIKFFEDLIQFLSENLPKVDLIRNGNEIGIEMPEDLSKRAIRLRIRKFLHKKDLKSNFRPVNITNSDKNGYIIKEKRKIELPYY
ncbi:MAG: hypothetical protein P8Y70_09915 [Candidatus Lokiarchaeota archaeon]